MLNILDTLKTIENEKLHIREIINVFSIEIISFISLHSKELKTVRSNIYF
jgi:hypothetical protein